MSRADRVAARVAAAGLDALLVTEGVNVRYLTGFTGSNAVAVVGAGIRRFVTDGRYTEQARAEVAGFDRETAPPRFLDALGRGWPPGPLRLGFEDADVTVRRHGELRERLPARVELVAAGSLVEAERRTKEPGEVERIRAATALADAVFEWVLEHGLVGRTERAVAVALEHRMRELGADGPSFPPIVASAERGALPHARPTDAVIGADALVTLDLGARLDGYCSDGTRTWATGTPPDDLAAVHALVLDAQARALAAVRPGVPGRDVDAVARDLIAAAGHGERFGHGLGHGVGLEVHEAPRLARTAAAPLAAGDVVTVEPGVYLPGRGGVRIEDLVVVTRAGCEVLGGTPRGLRVAA